MAFTIFYLDGLPDKYAIINLLNVSYWEKDGEKLKIWFIHPAKVTKGQDVVKFVSVHATEEEFVNALKGKGLWIG